MGDPTGAGRDDRRSISAGLALFPTQGASEMRRLAHLAEDLGYANLWFGDSQNIWREAHVTMGAAAVGTERIIVGAGVSNVATRHPSVLASAWATLHELTDGRVAAGFGRGFTSVRTMGLEPTPLVDLEAAVGDLRRLWRGEAVVEASSASHYRLSYVEQPLDIPIYLAASGPRLLALAGRIADGVIILVGTDPGAVRTAVGHVAAGASEAGRSLDDVHVVLWCSASIHADGAYARDLVRPQVASTVMQTVQVHLPPEELADVERIRGAYDYYDHNVVGSAHARLVTDALTDRFSLAGTPDECRSRLDTLSTTGIDQVSIVPFVPPGQNRSEVLHAFASVLSSMP